MTTVLSELEHHNKIKCKNLDTDLPLEKLGGKGQGNKSGAFMYPIYPSAVFPDNSFLGFCIFSKAIQQWQ